MIRIGPGRRHIVHLYSHLPCCQTDCNSQNLRKKEKKKHSHFGLSQAYLQNTVCTAIPRTFKNTNRGVIIFFRNTPNDCIHEISEIFYLFLFNLFKTMWHTVNGLMLLVNHNEKEIFFIILKSIIICQKKVIWFSFFLVFVLTVIFLFIPGYYTYCAESL